MSLTLNSLIWNVIGSNLHTTSNACTSSLPNMEGITNNTLPNTFELKDNSIVEGKTRGNIIHESLGTFDIGRGFYIYVTLAHNVLNDPTKVN